MSNEIQSGTRHGGNAKRTAKGAWYLDVTSEGADKDTAGVTLVETIKTARRALTEAGQCVVAGTQ